MKTFLIKILFFFLPLLILGIGTEFLLRRIPNEYSIKRDYLDKNAPDIKILILGSSHAYRGLNPEYFSQPAFNAAMFSQSLDYDLKIIERYKNELENLNTIIIPISYFTLFSNLDLGIEKWRIKDYNIYYDFPKGSNGDFSTEIFNTPVKRNIARVKDFYFHKEDNVEMRPNGWEGNDKTATLLELKETGIKAASRHTINSHIVLDDNIKYLNKIIDIASNQNWQVLIVIPPAFETYTEKLDKSQLHLTIEHCENISIKNSHVKFINLLKSSEFILNDFYDADHLNTQGAKKLSVLLDHLITN